MIDARRIEEAGLNALQTQRQLFYDGWLLRVSPGTAKRARSVNAHFGSSLPLESKIEHCERVYRERELPALFRITPFVAPTGLEHALHARGYAPFDTTLVQAAELDGTALPVPQGPPVELVDASIDAFVDAVADLRCASPQQREAHRERLRHSPLDGRHALALLDGVPVAAGKSAREGDVVGVFDVVTATSLRGRGIATMLVARLLARAWDRGARIAYLQVEAGNAPAIAVYRRFGFSTLYRYHYCGREGECS
ncbi:MAG: GNAT family N-acetyltransferase [Betaproteobacteria bacterium]